VASSQVVYQGAALADGIGPVLRTPVTRAVRDGLITAIPDGDICHSHLTLQGGAQWIARGADPTPEVIDAAERNAAALTAAGIRWVRDVRSPRRADGGEGRERALADRWRGQAGYPYIPLSRRFLGRDWRRALAGPPVPTMDS